MSEKKEYREFWIRWHPHWNGHNITNVSTEEMQKEDIHVIEHSAFLELQAKYDEKSTYASSLLNEYDTLVGQYDSLKEKADKIVDKLKSGALLEVTGPTYREVKALIMEYDQSQVSKLINEE